MATKGLDLDTVIRGMHSSEIRVGIQTFNGGIVIWIGDRSNRVRAERVFHDTSRMTIDDTAVEWMHSTALRNFPDSNYAMQYRLRTSYQHPRLGRPFRKSTPKPGRPTSQPLKLPAARRHGQAATSIDR
jgi:hypothetical protein